MSSDFDWVTARSQCSVAKMFEELRLGVESDVVTRNALRHVEDRVHFIFTKSGGKFSVARDAAAEDNPVSVDFYLSNGAIRIEGTTAHFAIIATLNNEGECKPMIAELDGAELELWQVRRKALEGLFWPLTYKIERVGK